MDVLGSKRGRRASAAALVALGASLTVPMAGASALAGSPLTQEHSLKVAFVYNFTKFVGWPEAAFADESAALRVCLLGNGPFGAALQTLEGKPVRNRAVATTRLTEMTADAGCHVLVVSASVNRRTREILDGLGETSVLTIGETSNFAVQGGMIGFVVHRNKLRFEINPAVVERAGLTVSSQLLGLAEIVAAGEP